eukprot:3290267-Pleurochrysis_carterae.AAC.3
MPMPPAISASRLASAMWRLPGAPSAPRRVLRAAAQARPPIIALAASFASPAAVGGCDGVRRQGKSR